MSLLTSRRAGCFVSDFCQEKVPHQYSAMSMTCCLYQGGKNDLFFPLC